jgi:hypothetical protein
VAADEHGRGADERERDAGVDGEAHDEPRRAAEGGRAAGHDAAIGSSAGSVYRRRRAVSRRPWSSATPSRPRSIRPEDLVLAERAAETAFEIWPNSALTGSLNTELATPADFEGACKVLSKEDVAGTITHGPDLEPYVAEVRSFADAGYDHVYFHQVGRDQEGFFRFWEQELRPARAGPRAASAAAGALSFPGAHLPPHWLQPTAEIRMRRCRIRAGRRLRRCSVPL